MGNVQPRFEVVDARAWHCGQIVRQLRVDMASLLTRRDVDTHADLRACFDASAVKRAWLVDGELLAVGGVIGPHLMTVGTVWLAVSHRAKRYKIAMMREIKAQIEALLATRHELVAAIYPEDGRALAFAERLGFEPAGPSSPDTMTILRLRKAAPFVFSSVEAFDRMAVMRRA